MTGRPKTQSERFKEAARELGCDADTAFDEKLRRIGKAQPPEDEKLRRAPEPKD